MSSSPCRCLATVALCLAGTILCAPGQAVFEVLHEFERPGAQPFAPLMLHSDGHFYGTTVAGGACGHGAVFRLAQSGEMETIVSFTGEVGPTPGSAPIGILAEGTNGDLFGTTSAGGENGFGVAFKVSPAGAYTMLTEFNGREAPAKGSVPGGLVGHPDGHFYGTTQAGGVDGFGTVFRMSPTGNITTLLEFSGTAGAHPGSRPVGPLAMSGSTLYGVTKEGGATNDGTAFELTTDGVFRNLASFDGITGTLPSALVLHSNETLYGTTEFGGELDFGTAFSLTTGPIPLLTVLHQFDDVEGSLPLGHLTEAANRKLLGVASAGGTAGWGALFELGTDGSYRILKSFTGVDGDLPGTEPRAGLTVDPNDQLFGLTSAGGPANLGTAFKLDAGGEAEIVGNFSLRDGWFPSGAPQSEATDGYYFPVAAGGELGGGAIHYLTPGAPSSMEAALGGVHGDAPAGGLLEVDQEFFGVASNGGERSRGAAFKFDPVEGLSLLNTFRSAGGSQAEGPLVQGSDGSFYGTAREGGASGRGAIYRLTPDGERSRLVSFSGLAGSAPGESPRGPLVEAPNGEFYGVTEAGGAANAGVIFKLSPTGTYTVVHEFLAEGPRTPRGGLIVGPDGLFYGTTSLGGGSDAGAVIKIDPAGDSWSEVGSFTDAAGPACGRAPAGPLAMGPDGTLYGTVTTGGPDGFGGVFRVPPGEGPQTLRMFTGEIGDFPGRGEAVVEPFRFLGGLKIDPCGIIYGLAPAGGAKGGGVAFRIIPDQPFAQWKESFLGNREAADLGDFDEDNVPALLEYAFLLFPHVSDQISAQAELRAYPDGNRLAIEIPRDPCRHDITIRVEASTNLQDPWDLLAISSGGQPFTGPGVVTGDSASPGIKTVEIRDIVEFEAFGARFFRIGITRTD